VVTGTRKSLRPNKVVATFAMGTTGMYEWMNDNGAVEMLPVDYVNDPRTVSRERNFVSVNATTEVDLLGQCASETVAGRYWSSSGGQADFARGAMYSRAAARSSSCTRRPAAVAAASASASPRGPW
jgi:acyl-CoA hydrolase